MKHLTHLLIVLKQIKFMPFLMVTDYELAARLAIVVIGVPALLMVICLANMHLAYNQGNDSIFDLINYILLRNVTYYSILSE